MSPWPKGLSRPGELLYVCGRAISWVRKEDVGRWFSRQSNSLPPQVTLQPGQLFLVVQYEFDSHPKAGSYYRVCLMLDDGSMVWTVGPQLRQRVRKLTSLFKEDGTPKKKTSEKAEEGQ